MRLLTRSFRRVSSLSKFTEDQESLRATVAKFALDQIQPHVVEMDRHAKMNPQVVQGLFDNGLLGLSVPPEFGGAGMDFVDTLISIEEVARVDAGVAAMVDIHNTLVVEAFLQYGTPEQQAQHLPALANGTVGAFCLSEPHSGSDAFALSTKAVADGDAYLLTGSKAWISNALEADCFIVFANIDKEKLGYKGITAFIVRPSDLKDTSSFEIGKKEDKMGIRSSSCCQIHFNELRVGKDQVLGQVGQGYKIAISLLNEGRIGIAAQMLGIAKSAVAQAVEYASIRQQFQSTLLGFQAIRSQLADCQLSIEASQLLIYNAARVRAETPKSPYFPVQAAMAKLHASRTASQCTNAAIEVLGGVGFMRDTGVEKLYRDCKIGAIYEGTDNMQLETIGKYMKHQVESTGKYTF